MPRLRYVHPEFGFFCPTPRFRRVFKVAVVGLACAAVGFAVWAARDADSAHVAHLEGNAGGPVTADAATLPIPAANAAPVRGEAPAAATTTVRMSCADDAGASVDGKCTAGKTRKIRMVRVPTDRSAIASIPLGRTPAPYASPLEGAPATSVTGQGDAAPSRTAQAASAETAPAAEPRRKKSQRTAQNRRRDQSDGSTWREVRVDDWGARGYGTNDRGYQRGGYGRQGFFW